MLINVSHLMMSLKSERFLFFLLPGFSLMVHIVLRSLPYLKIFYFSSLLYFISTKIYLCKNHF